MADRLIGDHGWIGPVLVGIGLSLICLGLLVGCAVNRYQCECPEPQIEQPPLEMDFGARIWEEVEPGVWYDGCNWHNDLGGGLWITTLLACDWEVEEP